ncbi:MAG TPA: hypothetical protein ENN73_00090, partial [Firmicutes bacterium]|nr:hypothetical protein [Bacillota bacterium]
MNCIICGKVCEKLWEYRILDREKKDKGTGRVCSECRKKLPRILPVHSKNRQSASGYSTYVGYRQGGIWGAIFGALFGFLFDPIKEAIEDKIEDAINSERYIPEHWV